MANDDETCLATGATASKAGKDEVIAMVELAWRSAMLRQHGSKAMGLADPRMVVIPRSSASTPGSAAAPPLAYASCCDWKVVTWDGFGHCVTKRQEDGALDASDVGERRYNRCHVVGMGPTKNA